jgi:putative intracellular protease/amidase
VRRRRTSPTSPRLLSQVSSFLTDRQFLSSSSYRSVGATEAIPFLLETDLQKEGGIYSKASEDWGVHIVVDGTLLTGQNPNSAGPLAEEIKKALLK